MLPAEGVVRLQLGPVGAARRSVGVLQDSSGMRNSGYLDEPRPPLQFSKVPSFEASQAKIRVPIRTPVNPPWSARVLVVTHNHDPTRTVC